MGTNQREPALLMELSNIIDDPGPRCMTTATIGTHGLCMYILVTINTGHFGLLEFQGWMALLAISRNMLPFQRKNFIMVE